MARILAQSEPDTSGVCAQCGVEYLLVAFFDVAALRADAAGEVNGAVARMCAPCCDRLGKLLQELAAGNVDLVSSVRRP